MSNQLRETQRAYQATLEQIDRSIAGLKNQIADQEKRRADVVAAKTVIDDAVAKLPPEPKPEKQAKPASR